MVESSQNTSANSTNETTNVAANSNVNQGLQGSVQAQQNQNVNPQMGYQQGFAQQGQQQNPNAFGYQQNFQPNYQQQGLNQAGYQQPGHIPNPGYNVNQLNNAPENTIVGQQQDNMMTNDQRARYNEMIQKASAKKMVDLAPALDTYIKVDLEEKAALNVTIKNLNEENRMLRGELQRLANITLLSKHQFNTSDYDTVLKLCDYVVTDEKLINIGKDWRFQSLRNKRAEQKASQGDKTPEGLFDDIMGIKRA